MKQKKAPYYLLIHTDSYTGNFDRELIAYCFGILDKEQEDFAKEYSKAFWNKNYASDIDSLQEALKFEEEDKELFSKFDEYNDLIKQSGLDKEFLLPCSKKENWLNFYKEYLCETYQQVDDWKQNTFYNICRFYKNPQVCDTIYVQLQKPLSPELENIFINQIYNFFNEKVLNIVENYTYLCQFGHAKNSTDNINLLDLELVDDKNNLIKKYK